jgi:hypothetical protein
MRILTLLCFVAVSMQAEKVFAPLDDSDKEGTLDILVLNAWGDAGPHQFDLTLERLVNGKKVAELKAQQTLKLKYGTYRLVAKAGGMYPVEKIIGIKDAYQATVVCFFLAPIEEPWEGNLVRGHISETSKNRGCRWIRFVSPFADNGATETRASAAGDFAIENIRPGKYLALAIGESGLCESAPATILFGQRVTDLALSWTTQDGK